MKTPLCTTLGIELPILQADVIGDIEAGPLWARQGVGLVQREEPAAQIVATIANEARAALSLSE